MRPEALVVDRPVSNNGNGTAPQHRPLKVIIAGAINYCVSTVVPCSFAAMVSMSQGSSCAHVVGIQSSAGYFPLQLGRNNSCLTFISYHTCVTTLLELQVLA
jgi:hypothetical protein